MWLNQSLQVTTFLISRGWTHMLMEQRFSNPNQLSLVPRCPWAVSSHLRTATSLAVLLIQFNVVCFNEYTEYYYYCYSFVPSCHVSFPYKQWGHSLEPAAGFPRWADDGTSLPGSRHSCYFSKKEPSLRKSPWQLVILTKQFFWKPTMCKHKTTPGDTEMRQTWPLEKFFKAKWLRLSAHHCMQLKGRGNVLEP